MSGPARIIVLNGVGSVGKSTTARALQAAANTPFLYVAMDDFISMLPERMFGHPDGIVFEATEEDGKPSVIVRSGSAMRRTMRAMRHAIAAVAAQGCDLIVDDVMMGEGEEAEYRSLLRHFDLRLVGLFAPLDVIEARERNRGDRQIGLARWQYDRVHAGVTYDLRIDTAETTPMQNARRICDCFGL